MPLTYDRVERDDEVLYIHTLDSGAEVHRNTGEEDGYDAYNPQGKWLGGGTEGQCLYRAQTGKAGIIHGDSMMELSLWPAWNDALDSGCVPLVDEDGDQFLCLPDSRTFLRVSLCEDSFCVSIVTEDQMATYFWDEEHDCYDLTYLEGEPFRLE